MAQVEDQGAGGTDDPEAQLNEWLGELSVLTAVRIQYYTTIYIVDIYIIENNE